MVGTITKNSSKISITTFGRNMTDSRNQWEAVAGDAVAPPVAWPAIWSKNRNKRVAGKGRQCKINDNSYLPTDVSTEDSDGVDND